MFCQCFYNEICSGDKQSDWKQCRLHIRIYRIFPGKLIRSQGQSIEKILVRATTLQRGTDWLIWLLGHIWVEPAVPQNGRSRRDIFSPGHKQLWRSLSHSSRSSPISGLKNEVSGTLSAVPQNSKYPTAPKYLSVMFLFLALSTFLHIISNSSFNTLIPVASLTTVFLVRWIRLSTRFGREGTDPPSKLD